MTEFVISLNEFTVALKKLPKWKSPGLDGGVYGYWLKYLSSAVHLWLHYYFIQLLSEPSQLFPSLLAKELF